MDWAHDYCLSCDRQISQSDHGPYCSQACRLADVERAAATSPTPSYASSSSCTHSGQISGFSLPPALNFTSHAPREPSSASSSPTPRSPISAQHYSTTPPSYNPQLYSSSRSSVSSFGSSQQEPLVLSDKVKNELREYAGSFDHVRDWKRKMTVHV